MSHAGEDQRFVASLLKAIKKAHVGALFDSDLVAATPLEHEIISDVSQAGQAIVVLSRDFLTNESSMEELRMFLKCHAKIIPLYHGISQDELREIIEIYDRQVVEQLLGVHLLNNDT